ncbi:uncharacterized protein LOC130648095 [Hydractinia symbiolongicarpus]|uniref:uncharacterized protein LOC130648095 n=1 Tax=Hydractinia symbiolongicarpus TaxID=13093 RepID=UPI00254B8338|nr:uncharacterized protein LOC130648095 [Hydractinia symbiolongicarpus]
MKEISVRNPFQTKKGSTQRRMAWQDIAENCEKSSITIPVSERVVRERFIQSLISANMTTAQAYHRSVIGSFNQGDPRFGETAGVQCTQEHDAMLKQQRDKYQSEMGTQEHKAKLKQKRDSQRDKYQSKIGSPEHLKKLKRNCDFHQIQKSQEMSTLKRIENFKKAIIEGPVFICIVCNPCLYRKSVVVFYNDNYKIDTTDLLLKSEIPAQAVCNKLDMFDSPDELETLNRLEKTIIARRILFKKITIMPKGQSPKLKGTICNVPINCQTIVSTLPHGADTVNPQSVKLALLYLKQNNPLYSDITIDENLIPSSLVDLRDPVETECTSESNDHELEEVENPLNANRFNANESMMLSNVPQAEDISIAPGEGEIPFSMMNDQFCEELAHPYLFPTGKFSYKVERDIKLSPTKYFNQRLLNYKQKFASNSDYIFYVLSTLQQLNMSSQINIAVKKVKTDSLTAGMLSKNFSETVQSCIAEDKGFQFMSPIKAKLNSENLTDEEIINLTYFERCRFLNLNPVLLARHFQYRVELFFKEIVVDGPLGKVKYCAIRVEFQIRGSPHIHSFLWVLNAPVLTENNIDKYIQFVDAIIKAYEPDREHERELFDLVTTYQVHSHSKSCRKYTNETCRYHFGRFFSERTIVALPLSKDIDPDERSEILKNKEVILNKVKDYIDTELNPKKKNILNSNQENFEITPTISEILDELDIPESEYYNALSISNGNDFQLYLKRPPDSCFINNYFDEGLLAWEANIDIQPVFNHYKAVTYMCAYFLKCEDETSQAMKQAAKEAFNSNKSYTEQMKLIAKVFTTKRECSVQEAVYLIMPELWLRKTFPKVVFANTNLPEKRYRMCRSKHEIDELPEDSTDMFKRNMLNRYVDRPNPTFAKGEYAILDQFCYAQFLANYYLAGRFDDENDSQPTVLRDDNIERNHITNWFPAILPLMSSNEKLKCRKVKQVLRLYTPNKHKYPELYAHHLLMLYYPFRNECDLKSASDSYVEKLNEPGVLSIINKHKQTFEPFSDLIDTALSNLRTDLLTNQDAFTAHENDEVQDEMIETIDEIVDDENVVFDSEINVSTNNSEFLSNAELNPMISSLNYKQRQVFDLVYDWACRYIKNLSAIRKIEVTPLYIFLTGAGGCGKSHLIKTIYQAMSKVLSYKSKDLNKPKVFLVAPTSVAAININGTTIHTAFGIPVGHFGKNLPRLNDKRRSTLRNKLSELKAIIVDEISMVSNLQLFYIHLRLIEIFACRDEIPFAGITVIACGDLYQLPPVQQRPVYADYKSDWLNLVHLWKLFEFAELTEVMRQKGDNVLIDLLVD